MASHEERIRELQKRVEELVGENKSLSKQLTKKTRRVDQLEAAGVLVRRRLCDEILRSARNIVRQAEVFGDGPAVDADTKDEDVVPVDDDKE